MGKVTISEKEYQDLVVKKLRYEQLRGIIEADIFVPPPTKNSKEIIGAFRKTKKYNEAFLRSLENGMRASVYFKK